MDKQRFFELTSSPEVITATDTALLSDLIEDYPYFHTAYLLLVYHLKAGANENFSQALHDYALHVANRKVLFNLINSNTETSKIIQANTILQQENVISNDIAEFQLEESTPVFQIEEQEPALDLNIPDSLIELEEPLNIIEDSLEMAKVVEFDLASTSDTNVTDHAHDLIDDFLSFLESPTDKEEKETLDQVSLIDKFITENPAFTPNKLILNNQQEDISVGSIAEDEELASETLAQVFESQKLYDKAIVIYEKLILKFPEKSTYFASRIEELRIKFK
jgi:hypothetical protein